jgi:glycosyltransferase involved in cell wall biosynthesis
MEIVVASQPQAHLLLLGGGPNMEYVRRVRDQIDSSGLQGAVTVMGIRDDIAEVLAACDIGVLSSASEGLPMALLEYGRSGLPSVVTDVGQCSEVVDRGAAGFLVPPHDPEALAKGILRLLASPVLRRDLGLRLRERVEACYGLAAGMSGIVGMYTHLIERRA